MTFLVAEQPAPGTVVVAVRGPFPALRSAPFRAKELGIYARVDEVPWESSIHVPCSKEAFTDTIVATEPIIIELRFRKFRPCLVSNDLLVQVQE